MDRDFERNNYSVVESDYKEPATYETMLKRPEEERRKWEAGMEKEFKDFERRKVWKVIGTKDVPEKSIMAGIPATKVGDATKGFKPYAVTDEDKK